MLRLRRHFGQAFAFVGSYSMRGQFKASTVTPDDATGLAVLQTSRMQPISFNGCFGWLHVALDGAMARTAVVLCSGLTADEKTGYRSLRILADALASAGYPTLRFHYPGTGNSSEPDVVEHWAVCQRSIHDAADYLRSHLGAWRIVLVGLRIGATLAALVAENRTDVVGLVLLAPILRGRSYVRQLTIEANLQNGAKAAGGDIVVGDLRLSGETVQLINQVDLRRLALVTGCKIAVYSQTLSPVLSECLRAWGHCGAEVTREGFTGLEPLLRPTFMCHEASAQVARLIAWLRMSVPPRPLPLQKARVPGCSDIQIAGCTETPLRFGVGERLFGVLCRPCGCAEADLAVVIGNSGGNPHCIRATVDLARRLADTGIASLRMDFAGLGDSLAPGDVETHLFEADRRPDISAAIDALEDCGYRRFATHGVCAGAYHAFHAALADPRVRVVLLVNLPLFQWRAGDAIELMPILMRSPLENLASKKAWKRLLEGRINVLELVALQGALFAKRTKAMGRRLAGRVGPPSFAQDGMDRLSQRARTLFLFSEGDAGIAALETEFGSALPPPGATVRVIPGLDHALTSAKMRRSVAIHMIEFLKREPVSQAVLPSHGLPSRCLT